MQPVYAVCFRDLRRLRRHSPSVKEARQVTERRVKKRALLDKNRALVYRRSSLARGRVPHLAPSESQHRRNLRERQPYDELFKAQGYDLRRQSEFLLHINLQYEHLLPDCARRLRRYAHRYDYRQKPPQESRALPYYFGGVHNLLAFSYA